ncbi:hypothetical protein VNO80_28798 [Phaseolus coccineus]|uniref:Uncharacterized protein n=1 Tax=Phaseolus coccineus TaxID=3886 RepID=A0AAN9LB22_PHACN
MVEIGSLECGVGMVLLAASAFYAAFRVKNSPNQVLARWLEPKFDVCYAVIVMFQFLSRLSLVSASAGSHAYVSDMGSYEICF